MRTGGVPSPSRKRLKKSDKNNGVGGMPRRNAAHNASRNNAALGRSVLVTGGAALEGARDAEDAEDVPPWGLGDDDLVAYDAEMEEGDALRYRDEVDLTGAEVDEFDGDEAEDEDAEIDIEALELMELGMHTFFQLFRQPEERKRWNSGNSIHLNRTARDKFVAQQSGLKRAAEMLGQKTMHNARRRRWLGLDF